MDFTQETYLLLHTIDEETVETTDFTRGTCFEEGEDSAGKAMATVFWDSQGIHYINNLKKGKTVRVFYHVDQFVRLFIIF